MAARSGGKVKITLNMDKDIVEEFKYVADEAGASYQKLMNRILKEALVIRNDTASRLLKLEKEVKILKHRSA